MSSAITENLRTARNMGDAATDSLRAALRTANAVQGLAILALIERAATLARDIDALRAAVAEDENTIVGMKTALQRIAVADPKEWCAATIARTALAS